MRTTDRMVSQRKRTIITKWLGFTQTPLPNPSHRPQRTLCTNTRTVWMIPLWLWICGLPCEMDWKAAVKMPRIMKSLCRMTVKMRLRTCIICTQQVRLALLCAGAAPALLVLIFFLNSFCSWSSCFGLISDCPRALNGLFSFHQMALFRTQTSDFFHLTCVLVLRCLLQGKLDAHYWDLWIFVGNKHDNIWVTLFPCLLSLNWFWASTWGLKLS